MADELRIDLPDQLGLTSIYAVASIGRQVLQPDGTLLAMSPSTWLSGKVVMSDAVLPGVYLGTFPAAAPAGVYWITLRNGAGLSTDASLEVGLMEWKGPGKGEASLQSIELNPAVGTINIVDMNR